MVGRDDEAGVDEDEDMVAVLVVLLLTAAASAREVEVEEDEVRDVGEEEGLEVTVVWGSTVGSFIYVSCGG